MGYFKTTNYSGNTFTFSPYTSIHFKGFNLCMALRWQDILIRKQGKKNTKDGLIIKAADIAKTMHIL